MRTSLSPDDLLSYNVAQCRTFFPDSQDCFSGTRVRRAFDDALLRTEECFRHITLRGFSEGGEALFSHLHSDQYSQFLYLFSNSLWKVAENDSYARRLLCLNRALSGLFVSYKCPLPEHFLFGHAVGSVIGNAGYSDCCVFFQNITVNTGADGSTRPLPEIGRGLFMAAGSSIIGTQQIGDRVSIGVGACVYGTPVPDDAVAIQESGALTIRARKDPRCEAQNFFDISI